jgi:hypothetical protein
MKKNIIKQVLSRTGLPLEQVWEDIHGLPSGYDSFTELQLTVALRKKERRITSALRILERKWWALFTLSFALVVVLKVVEKEEVADWVLPFVSSSVLAAGVISIILLFISPKLVEDGKYIDRFNKAEQKLRPFLGVVTTESSAYIAESLMKKLKEKLQLVFDLGHYYPDGSEMSRITKNEASLLHHAMVLFSMTPEVWDLLWPKEVAMTKLEIDRLKSEFDGDEESPEIPAESSLKEITEKPLRG